MPDADAIYSQALEAYKTGELDQSRTGLEQARAAFIAQGNEKKAATVANDLAVVYYASGQRKEAQVLFEETLGVFEKAGDVPSQARALGNLAQVTAKMGNKDKARENYLRAAELFKQVGERTYVFDTYRALSQMELGRGRWAEALLAYDYALAAKGGSRLLRWFLQIPLKLLGVRTGA